MFDPSERPRIFGISPGVDFPGALVSGILSRAAPHPPEFLGNIELFVNTRRMQRRVLDLFEAGPSCLLPNVQLVTDFATRFDPQTPHRPISQLRRRLELVNLVSALLDQEPHLAPRSVIFDLADSLALLLDEMHDEGVGAEDILKLDVTDSSGHWKRSLEFLKIICQFTGFIPHSEMDIAARQKILIRDVTEAWKAEPPNHPIIVAGSTGSRGSTADLMNAVAHLPNGALVLPGFDFDLPQDAWDQLNDPGISEGHPQFRLGKVIDRAGCEIDEVQEWDLVSEVSNPARNRLISLALRPAPVTDQWMKEGPKLQDIKSATGKMTLIEAPSNRSEAMAIALILRCAAEENRTAALVTPDKSLSRRVKAALDRWRIEPDISAGDPLETTAIGRLFRHVSDCFGAGLSAEDLLVLLKHPLTNSAGDRVQHLAWTRALELKLRRDTPAFASTCDLFGWIKEIADGREIGEWVAWICDTISPLQNISVLKLEEFLEIHLATVEKLLAGPSGGDTDVTWATPSGLELSRVLSELKTEARHANKFSCLDYGNLFVGILKRAEVRDPVRPHPNIMIWGTLESRVQGADLIVLGGLNEGTWPRQPAADPWLNREMRMRSGLLLPDRQIGLSAHDFQQAISAENVVLSRSIRDDEAPTVPSRWLSRITNLLGGISDESKVALDQMQARGAGWLDLVVALETPEKTASEPRPAPCPPVNARPKVLPVTAITKLIRDPYAIYARYVLRLRPLDPLNRQPDARIRGIVMHKIMEKYIRGLDLGASDDELAASFLQVADAVFDRTVPWPVAKVLWRARLEKNTHRLIAHERDWQSDARPVQFERSGSLSFPELDFVLSGIADRIDVTMDGQHAIFDYKTGKIPTKKEVEFFDKQLLLEAMIMEFGGFEDVGSTTVKEVAHIGIGSDTSISRYLMDAAQIQEIRRDFIRLISSFQKRPLGYTSRRAVAKTLFSGTYDHLARFGEWDDSQSPTLFSVGHDD